MLVYLKNMGGLLGYPKKEEFEYVWFFKKKGKWS